MRQTLLAIPFVLSAACTASTPESTADLTCLGEQRAVRPETTLDGFVLDEIGGAPISGALVEVRAADGSLLANAATDDTGAYAMTAQGGAFRHAIALGYLDAYAYSTPFAGDPEALPMLTRSGADQLAREAGVAIDLDQGVLLIVALDCAGHPVQGAQIRVPNAAAVAYLGRDAHFDPALTSTSSNSAALAIGVPVGGVDVEIDVDGVTYHSIVESRANALVTTWVRP